jgi:hypothetical protein
MDLFNIDAFQGAGTNAFPYMPMNYRRVKFIGDDGKPVRMHRFVRRLLQKKLDAQVKDSTGTLDQNIDRLSGIDTVLSDLKNTGIFKSCVVKFKSLKKQEAFRKNDLEFHLKKKSMYYFSMQQSFNTEGNITISYSGGLRNIAGLLDNLSFSYEKSLQKDKLAQVNLNWSAPILPGGLSLDLGYYKGSASLDTHLVEKKESYSVKVGVPVRETTVKYSWEDRQNLFDPDDVCTQVLMHEVQPSMVQKYEVKTNWMQHARGGRTDFKLTQTMGDANLTTLEIDSKTKYDMKGLFSEAVQPKFRDITLENLFNIRWIALESNPLRVNDLLHFSQLRGFNRVGVRLPAHNRERHPRHPVEGFHHLGDHLGSRLAVRNTSKLIFNSYPYLKDNTSLKTFFHLTSVLTSQHKWKVNFHEGFSMAAGLGVDLAYGPANIEFLYNFWHKKTVYDQRNYFQVKFSFGD